MGLCDMRLGSFVSGSMSRWWWCQSTKRTSDKERANTSANSRTRDFTLHSWSSVRLVLNSILDTISSTRSWLKGSRIHRDSFVPRSILNGSWWTSPSLCIPMSLESCIPELEEGGLVVVEVSRGLGLFIARRCPSLECKSLMRCSDLSRR